MYGWLIYDAEGRARNGWFIEQLVQYASSCGVCLEVVDAEAFCFGVRNGGCFAEPFEGKRPDFVLVRTIFPLIQEILEHLEIPAYNSAKVSSVCNDKRRTHAFFARGTVPMAESFFCSRRCFDADRYGYPAVLKLASGHGGREVFLVQNREEALALLPALSEDAFLLQEPVDQGRDVRVYLLDGRVLAAVERTSETDFRSNFSLGGKVRLFAPDESMLKVVEEVKSSLDPLFVGVDFTFRKGEPLLNEIEDVVGTRMLYKLTDLPVHRLFLDAVFRKVYEKST